MRWLLTRRQLLRHLDRGRLERAIAAAERATSGEIRISVAPFFWGDVQRAAERAFQRLGMRGTEERNGVLLFVVPSRRRLAVLGDEGIHQRVGQQFWEELVKQLTERFRTGSFTEGLEQAVQHLGEQLARHFPHAGAADRNELHDDVDLGP